MRGSIFGLALVAALPFASQAFAGPSPAQEQGLIPRQAQGADATAIPGQSTAQDEGQLSRQLYTPVDAPLANPVDGTIVPGSASQERLNWQAEREAVAKPHPVVAERAAGPTIVLVPGSGADF